MRNVTHKLYWIKFNTKIYNQTQLNINELKLCKQFIDYIENCGLDYTGSKDKPIIIDECTLIKFMCDYNNKIFSNPVENDYEIITKSNSIKDYILGYIFNHIYIHIQPIIKFITAKLGYSNSKLDLKHYYNINNTLYITYEDSLVKFKSINLYLSELSSKNNFKKLYLYKDVVALEFKAVNFINHFLFKFILYIHMQFLKCVYSNRFNARINQTNWGFYNYSKTNFKGNMNSFMSGLKYIWSGISVWILSLFIIYIIVYFLLFIRILPFNKLILSWVLLIMFIYWIISGFIFFIKKYQYSRYTSSIQRFWKRTYIIFWIIEAGTFLVFFYLTINATSEPIYMYDQIKIYKTHLFSWRWFLIKLLPLVLVILLSYFLQLTMKWNTSNKQSTIILSITLLLLYILWLEFYQFYHIISFYSNIAWVFDYDEYIWSLEFDSRKTRLTNNYISICLFAKFWHFVFVFIFWVFFVLRVNELNRVRYPLIAANLQNFIIIYIMSWVYMYPWIKFIFRKYLDITYYWFYMNSREIGVRIFFIDIKLILYGLIESVFNSDALIFKINEYPFYYWINSSLNTNYEQYKKSIIRDSIIINLNSYNI